MNYFGVNDEVFTALGNNSYAQMGITLGQKKSDTLVSLFSSFLSLVTRLNAPLLQHPRESQ